jgi:phytoene dehydrogenase-like protein
LHSDVIIIGAGLSGLACALRLQQGGLRPRIIEAAPHPGGRIATDERDGFLLDRGFQVLQTWYPEARRMLDYRTLDLRPFYPGALVRIGDDFHRVSDIWRRPLQLLEMIRSPVGSFGDKLRLLRLRHHALEGDLEALYARPESSALEYLARFGFSERIIERFFKPFFAGVFFEPELSVSSRAFEFVFRAFALGDTALPAGGMRCIPEQLAARLAPDSIQYGCRVQRLLERQVLLDQGERLSAQTIIIATEGAEAARLLGKQPRPVRGTTCLYFAAPEPPFDGPYLVLDGSGQGPVNSLLCPSNLSAAYAPSHQALISVNVFGAEQHPDVLEAAVRAQLGTWYGEVVHSWQRLAVVQLPAALPVQATPVVAPSQALQIQDWLWVCGEFAAPPSIHWAFASGNQVAEAVLNTRHSGHIQEPG